MATGRRQRVGGHSGADLESVAGERGAAGAAATGDIAAQLACGSEGRHRVAQVQPGQPRRGGRFGVRGRSVTGRPYEADAGRR